MLTASVSDAAPDTLAVIIPAFNEASSIGAVLDSHFSGRADRSHEIWSLLVLMLWFDQYGTSHAN